MKAKKKLDIISLELQFFLNCRIKFRNSLIFFFYDFFFRSDEEIEYGWWNILCNNVRISIIRNVISGANE